MSMKLSVLLLITVCTQPVFSCVPPVVSTEYFAYNVTQISASLGSFIRVQCIADPATDVTSYVWQKNGENVQEPSIHSSFLIIRSLAVEDGGLYRCEVVTASCGTRYSPEISINTAPDTVRIIGPSQVPEGEEFQLTCSANGWPPSSYEWSFNGGVVGTDSVYRVSSAHYLDTGEYTCSARNSRGQISNRTFVEVTVQATSQPVLLSTTSTPAATPAATPPPINLSSQPTPSSPATLISLSVSKAFTIGKDMMMTTQQESFQTTHAIETQTPGTTVDDSSPGQSSTVPAAPFIVMLALSIALLVALIGITCFVFLLVIYTMRQRPFSKSDRKRLLEEEADGGVEMTDVNSRDAILEKAPVSYVNIAFGQDSDDEDEEEGGQEEEEIVTQLVSGAELKGPTSLKLSPQRYQSSSKPSSPSQKQFPSTDLSHSVSMDVPKELTKTPSPVNNGRVPHYKAAGAPSQFKAVHHLTPPIDRHRADRKKKAKSGKKHVRSSAPPMSEIQYTDMDKVQLLTAMEADESFGTDQTQPSNATVVTTVSMEQEREEGQEAVTMTWVDKLTSGSEDRVGKEGRGVEEVREGEEGDSGGERGPGKEGMKTEAAVVQEAIGEASITFEQEGNTSSLFRDEGSRALLSSGEEEGDTEGGYSRENIGGEEGEHLKENIGGEEGEHLKENIGEEEGEHLKENIGEEEGEHLKENIGEEEGEHLKGGEEEGGNTEGEHSRENIEGRNTEGEHRENIAGEEAEKSAGEDKEEIKGGSSLDEVESGGGDGGTVENDREKEDIDPDIHRMSVFIEKAKKMGRSVSYVAQLDRSHPLNLADIQELVEEAMTGDKGNTLTVEYKSVPHNSIQTLPLSTEEKHKNRYRNVLPNPHSAVRLSDTGVPGSTYINANYIRGYGERERQYIATQGPTNYTVPDFWRMVWEKEVSIIVMTTPLVERGHQKCVKYWPASDDTDTAIYGNIVVRNNYEEVTKSYTTSYLSICTQSPDGEEMGEERDVYHFWYTAWSDFSVPKETGSILRLREAVDVCRIPTTGPIVVHCSAGLGRSGTFMAIDIGIQQYEKEGIVDPLKYMCEMRQDRGGIIQTPDQYVYIHRALKDYMTS